MLTIYLDAQSMRDVIFMIDNDQDFKKFILSMESKLPAPPKPAEIRYEKHPVCGASAHAILQRPETDVFTGLVHWDA